MDQKPLIGENPKEVIEDTEIEVSSVENSEEIQKQLEHGESVESLKGASDE